MLAFVDESGDPGRKIANGSSQYFVIAVVTFIDHDEATACDRRIAQLRDELPYRGEFHFSDNADRIREAFLHAVAPHPFFYDVFALNKDPRRLTGRGFDFKESLYKWTARAAMENATLDNAIVVIDKSGNREFRNELAAYLRQRLVASDGKKLIQKVKVQRSDGNNLLQLADYVAGVSNRAMMGKRDGVDWREKYLIRHESSWRIWP